MVRIKERIYFVPEAQLQGMMAEQFTPLAAYGFMAFVLLYVPCLATVAVIKKETNVCFFFNHRDCREAWYV